MGPGMSMINLIMNRNLQKHNTKSHVGAGVTRGFPNEGSRTVTHCYSIRRNC